MKKDYKSNLLNIGLVFGLFIIILPSLLMKIFNISFTARIINIFSLAICGILLALIIISSTYVRNQKK